MSEIDIPILTIADGWSIDQVQTIADCDDADALLTQVIAEIDGQLLEDRLAGFTRGPQWRAKANVALKMKRRALQQITQKRGEIGRAARQSQNKTRDRELLDLIKRDFPDQFRIAVETFIAERGGQAHG